MEYSEFQENLTWLAAHYEKTLSEKLTEALWSELKAWRRSDWYDATRALAFDGQQRAWPRLGALIAALYHAADKRILKEAMDNKRHEEAEMKRLMTPDRVNTNKDNARRLVATMCVFDPVIRRQQLAALHAEFSEAAEAENFPPKPCCCENGLVFIQPSDGSCLSVARCGKCPLGKTASVKGGGDTPKVAWADPFTMQTWAA